MRSSPKPVTFFHSARASSSRGTSSACFAAEHGDDQALGIEIERA